jgi:hypothetical protein
MRLERADHFPSDFFSHPTALMHPFSLKSSGNIEMCQGRQFVDKQFTA